MKTITVLKTLINIYYYLMIVALVAGFITIPLLLFTNQPYTMSLFGNQIDIGELSIGKSITVITLLGLVLYFYFRAIQVMRNTVKELVVGQYFSERVITNFKKMGTLFLICGIGFFVVNIILKLLLENRLSVGLDSSLFLFVITGLFFLFLSEVFKVAKDATEENNLTI
jgi:hypothetical protein